MVRTVQSWNFSRIFSWERDKVLKLISHLDECVCLWVDVGGGLIEHLIFYICNNYQVWPHPAPGSGFCWGLPSPGRPAVSHQRTGLNLMWEMLRKPLISRIIQKNHRLGPGYEQEVYNLRFKSWSTSFPHLSQESLSQAAHCIFQVYLPVVSKYWVKVRYVMCTWWRTFHKVGSSCSWKGSRLLRRLPVNITGSWWR